ncbi:YafY family protein [Nonomuraea sp. NPDC000554]|uniref:helix-turn-helix transcriptional regulator n=1 Tax=Nonomuraea sp. NPDC000554 TaxID=3154259 RepID=UPI00332D7938
MSRPTARVLALLEILQAGGVHPVGGLSERLGVDARTVRRYVDHLVDLDVPVESVRGRYGGYRLARGYRMPPLMLTEDEALATVLGLMTVHKAGLAPTADVPPDTAADTAAAKLRRVLPKPLDRRLDALLATTRFTAPADRTADGPGGHVLLMLAEAAADRRPVSMEYRNRRGEPSQRVIHPYGLVAHSGRWYVTGADSERGDVRTFRVDRVGHLRVLPGSFVRPENFDAAAHTLTTLAETPWAHDVEILVQGTLEHIRSQFPEGIALLDAVQPATATRMRSQGPDEPTRPDQWFRVRIRAERLDWIPPLIAALDCPFVLKRPSELRTLVQEFAQRLTRFAGVVPDDDRADRLARRHRLP